MNNLRLNTKTAENKIKTGTYIEISVFVFLIYAFYYGLFAVSSRHVIEIALLFVSLLFGILSLLPENRIITINKSFLSYMSGWLLIIFLFFIYRNWWLKYSLWSVIRWLWVIFIAFCLSKSPNYLNKIYKIIIIVGFPNVIATIYFFFFRNAYTVMHSIYGQWPSGTGNGRYGFRAGLANHYSLNGIYLSIIFLALFSISLQKVRKQNKKISISFILTIISFFSLIISMKRAHIIFSIISIMLGLFFYNRLISVRQIINFISISIIIILLSVWIYRRFPEIGMVIERFENLGTDSNSTYRIKMWMDALNLFENHPLFGIGWGGFRLLSGHVLNAHNVYFQLLAETGVVGFSIYIINISIIMVSLIKVTRNISVLDISIDSEITCIYSLLICFFFILYSLTGNCLYDITFSFFLLPISSAYIFRQYQSMNLFRKKLLIL